MMTVGSGKKTEQRLCLLRGSVFFLLVCSTVLFGILTYTQFYNLEGKRLATQYDSIKLQFEDAIQHEITEKSNVMVSLGIYIQSQFPNSSVWPNVMMPMKVYESLTKPLIQMAGVNTISFSPIVKPAEMESFVNFTYESYAQQGYEELGIRNGKRGIFATNQTTREVYVEVDASSKQGQFDILLPGVQIGKLRTYENAILMNSYANSVRAHTVDVVINSTKKYQYQGAMGATGINIFSNGKPGGFVVHPVFSTNEKGENVTSGILTAGFNWEDLLKKSVPLTAKGLKATVTSVCDGVSTHSEEDSIHDTIVYEFEGGKQVEAVYKPEQDSVEGKPFATIHLNLLHHYFILSLYSTDEFVSNYRSNGPLRSSITVVSISLLTSLIFILYDLAMNRQKREKEIVAETKRLFVRYISHEIRTPLNTVHLGLQVLVEEMNDIVSTIELHSIEALKQCLNEWTYFVSNVDLSTEDAITVVSDLIDFDKLTTGMLNIERGLHDIWSLVADTAKPFTVQARSKHVKFITDFEPACKCKKMKNNKIENNNNNNNDDKDMVTLTKASNLYVYGDSVKIQQVIRNLISNSLKFTPEGGEVSVKACWKQSAPVPDRVIIPQGYKCSGMLVVKVKDTGAGLTQSQVDQLFQEGVQFDANKLQAGQGSGLGLWISKGVIGEHFGRLSATSPGKGFGSEFLMELPVFLPIDEDISWKSSVKALFNPDLSNHHLPKYSPKANSSKSNKSFKSNSFRSYTNKTNSLAENSNNVRLSGERKDEYQNNMMIITNVVKSKQDTFEVQKDDSITEKNEDRIIKILVVDDASSTRKVMARLLKNCGCITVEAGDGKECLDIISSNEHEFDLILMDYEMPIMNGPEATKKLKFELNCKIPVVGLTGNVLKSDALHFIEHGAVEVLTKPLKVANLKDMMNRVLHYSSNPNDLNYASSFNTSTPNITSSSSSSLPSSVAQVPSRNIVVDLCDKPDIKPATKTVKVLVVDDLASTRKVICRSLKNCGCITVEAGDGKECLDIISSNEHEFDLILMDYEMPIMNGPEATKKLKFELNCKIPIVGVTGNVLEADTNFFLAQGALEVLHKPLGVKMIKELLTRQLQMVDFSSPSMRDKKTELERNFSQSNNTGNKETSTLPKKDNKLKDEEEKEKKKEEKEDQDNEWFMMALNI